MTNFSLNFSINLNFIFRLGTTLIESSFAQATAAGVEFYFVHAVNSFAARIFRKFGFTSVHQINFEEYFKNSPEILKRLQPEHTVAEFMIKKLD